MKRVLEDFKKRIIWQRQREYVTIILYLDSAPASVSHDIDDGTEATGAGVGGKTAGLDEIVVFTAGFYGRHGCYVEEDLMAEDHSSMKRYRWKC